jgi:hypothetical protein
MNISRRADFKIYLKSATKQFCFSLIFPLIVYFIVKDKAMVARWVGLNFISVLAGYYKFKDLEIKRQRLKARGLTFEDLNNIEFTKGWFEIREKGIVKYSIIDGGIFFGFFLSLFIGIAAFFFKGVFDYVKTDAENMFNFIGLTYLAGAMSGVIIYRILWILNEQKFIRLTDPLH